MQRRSFWSRIRSGLIVATLCLGLTAVADAAPFGYITDSYDGKVTIIDLALEENHAVDAVPVGQGPKGVAVSPDGSLVYVVNYTSGSVSVIDANGAPVDTIDLGANSQPQGIAVSPDGSKAYVAHYGTSGAILSMITAVDNDYSVTDSIQTSADPTIEPFAVIAHPNGTVIYISNRLDNSVSVVNVTSGTFTTLVTKVPVGGKPQGMAITPDGTKLLVANNGGNSVAVVNTANTNLVEYISLETGIAPWAVAIHPDGNTAYVTGSSGTTHTVSVINLQDFEGIKPTITVGNKPQGIEVNSDGTFVYVANNGDETVSVINTETLIVDTTIDLYRYGGTMGGQIDIALGPVPKGILSVVSSLHFPDLIVNNTDSQTVMVKNRGILDLTLGSISSVTTPFSRSEDGCSGQTLTPGASCTFTVNFAPTTTGPFSDSFDIPYLDPEAGTATVSIEGYGLSTSGNQRPGVPALISPADGQTGVALTPTFTWEEVTDPNGDDVTYSILCSTSSTFTAGTLVALHFGEQKSLYASLGVGAFALFGIGAAGNRRNRKKLALLASLLILAGALVSACGGGGSPTSSPTGNEVEGTLLTTLSSGTTYYWKVVADDGRDGGTTESAVRSFTTRP